MKQQVNFYTDEFKPKKELLTLENMLVLWIASIVLVLALYNLEYKKTVIAEQNWQMTKNRADHQQKQLLSLQSNFADRGDALILEKTFQSLESRLEQRQHVLSQLSQRAEGMASGVAGLMENIAGITEKGLWLTSITVNEGQLSVSGITDDAEKVPQLIQRLQEISSLSDKRFSRLEIKTLEDNPNLLSFTLQSENQISSVSPKRRSSR